MGLPLFCRDSPTRVEFLLVFYLKYGENCAEKNQKNA